MTRESSLTTALRSAHMAMWCETVTYKQGGTGVGIPITARKAAVKTVSPGGEDVVVSSEWFDWVVVASDLSDIDDFEPAEGDTITLALTGGGSDVYHVGTYGADRCWEPADSAGSELVIHTKLWSELP